MTEQEFVKVIEESYKKFLATGSTSNEKLKILHWKIAEDVKNKLGSGYAIKSYGIGNGKEGSINGRYMQKRVDILISKAEESFAAIGIKFAMGNYLQNSNNYFEQMLGETANIRANKRKYFQVLILPEEMPYYDNKGKIKKWERIASHNIDKYIALSNDDTEVYLHTPIKTLLFIIKLPECDHSKVNTKLKYQRFYLKSGILIIEKSNSISGNFGEAIILNNYESFIKKVVHYLKSI